MVGMIDLNTTEEDEMTPSSGSLSSPSSSSNSAFSGSNNNNNNSNGLVGGSVCLELWHACAGPLISLPKKGSVVVYFPQGHYEQHQQLPNFYDHQMPPHVFCRVVDVKLHAEAASDEVYAQVSLLPESEDYEQKLTEGKVEGDGEEEDVEAAFRSNIPHMFCKTLTASDTSTHGGFSVPRRAAEDCFPPLDYTQQRPSQELLAKDLHGFEWRFRHIYRGQPRRHLLTTGWSAFVNKKKLVSGDAVLFLRGEDGELRLGIRRVAQVKSGTTCPVLSIPELNHCSPMDALSAISRRSPFVIYYNTRASASEFIVPVQKFLKSPNHSFLIGKRFKMRFETEDAAERRYTGTIIGISDQDPSRWPGSKWRCLMVRWDDVEVNRHGRVSPWEIELSGHISSPSSFIAPCPKRSRSGFAASKPEYLVADGSGALDFGESSRFPVLQGQEILCLNSLYADGDNCHPSELGNLSIPHGSRVGMMGNCVRESNVISDFSCKSTGFSGSFRSDEVLQGQEIFPSSPFGLDVKSHEARENGRLGISEGVQVLGSRSGWSSMIQGYSNNARLPSQASSPSSVLMFQQASNAAMRLSSIYNPKDQEELEVRSQKLFHDLGPTGEKFMPSHFQHSFRVDDQCSARSFILSGECVQCGISQPHVDQSTWGNKDSASLCKSSCRLFGFPLTQDRDGVLKESANAITYLQNPRSPFLSNVGEKFLEKPLAIMSSGGSKCTKGIMQCRPEDYHIY